MKKLVIGCDPDSNKSGFAVYVDGALVRLGCYSLIDFYKFLDSDCADVEYKNTELHIENLNGISSNAFSVKGKDPLPVKLKKAEHVGKCKQVQVEIERIAEYLGVKVVHHKVSNKWKDSSTGRAALNLHTGWTGQSNEDTRSAAYFGFIGSRP